MIYFHASDYGTHTVPRPRSAREVVAQRLATTEQSVKTSCTRSAVASTDITGPIPFVGSSSWSACKSSRGLFQPAKISSCTSDNSRSGLSLGVMSNQVSNVIVLFIMLALNGTHTKSCSSSRIKSAAVGERCHGGNMKPFSFAPSRIMISSRVVSFRVEAGMFGPRFAR